MQTKTRCTNEFIAYNLFMFLQDEDDDEESCVEKSTDNEQNTADCPDKLVLENNGSNIQLLKTCSVILERVKVQIFIFLIYT